MSEPRRMHIFPDLPPPTGEQLACPSCNGAGHEGELEYTNGARFQFPCRTCRYRGTVPVETAERLLTALFLRQDRRAAREAAATVAARLGMTRADYLRLEQGKPPKPEPKPLPVRVNVQERLEIG